MSGYCPLPRRATLRESAQLYELAAARGRTMCATARSMPSQGQRRSVTVTTTFGIPVIVETPSGAVNKTAIKAVVTYQVSVTNNSSQVTVEINSLVDNVYGDLATRSGSTCSSLIGTT